MEEEIDERSNNKPKKFIILMLSCMCFLAPSSLILAFLKLDKSITNSTSTATSVGITTAIYVSTTTKAIEVCANKTGICANLPVDGTKCFLPAGFDRGNDTITDQICKTTCSDELFSFICPCSAGNSWSLSSLKCYTTCPASGICDSYAPRYTCAPTNIVPKETGGCTDSCGDGSASYSCVCKSGFTWTSMNCV